MLVLDHYFQNTTDYIIKHIYKNIESYIDYIKDNNIDNKLPINEVIDILALLKIYKYIESEEYDLAYNLLKNLQNDCFFDDFEELILVKLDLKQDSYKFDTEKKTADQLIELKTKIIHFLDHYFFNEPYLYNNPNYSDVYKLYDLKTTISNIKEKDIEIAIRENVSVKDIITARYFNISEEEIKKAINNAKEKNISLEDSLKDMIDFKHHDVSVEDKSSK